MADTKITRLRNLMTPLVNYFKMPEHSEELKGLLVNEKRKCVENLPEIREILSTIPDDACEGSQTNSENANCAIFDVSGSWRFCPNCGITWEKDSVPFGCWSCGYDSHVC